MWEPYAEILLKRSFRLVRHMCGSASGILLLTHQAKPFTIRDCLPLFLCGSSNWFELENRWKDLQVLLSIIIEILKGERREYLFSQCLIWWIYFNYLSSNTLENSVIAEYDEIKATLNGDVTPDFIRIATVRNTCCETFSRSHVFYAFIMRVHKSLNNNSLSTEIFT